VLNDEKPMWRIFVLDPRTGERTLHRELETPLGNVDDIFVQPDGGYAYTMPDGSNDLYLVEGLR
jgi:hypothetical protein